MNFNMNNDNHYMAQALRLAANGLWTTDPNPRVGCVLVKNGSIIGSGWHHAAGLPHAEIEALRAAGEAARGATCYVTLEPCCHHGRTPPCSEALIQAGVARVVCAGLDPNPLVEGKGLKQLSEAGIEVRSGVLEAEAAKLNPGFLKRMRTGKPYVRCKLAMSLDGRTAMASGESQWITGPEARRDVQGLRARSSVIMTGIGTVLADNPSMTVRPAELPEERPAPEKPRQPLRVVIDQHLSMPLNAKMLDLPGDTLIVTASDDEEQQELLREAGAEICFLPSREGCVDLHALVEQLGERDINEIHLEAGHTLSGVMLKAGLIDEIVLYVAPVLMGDNALGLFHLPLQQMNEKIHLHIQDIRAIGKDWRISAVPA